MTFETYVSSGADVTLHLQCNLRIFAWVQTSPRMWNRHGKLKLLRLWTPEGLRWLRSLHLLDLNTLVLHKSWVVILYIFSAQRVGKGNRKRKSKLGRKISLKKAGTNQKRTLLEPRNPLKESCAARSTVEPACLCGEISAYHSAGNDTN